MDNLQDETRPDIATRFQGTGVGVKHSTKPISVMLPPQLDQIVRSLPDRSAWLREAIREKAERENLIPAITDNANSLSK